MPEQLPFSFTAAVFAGGASARMGSDKAFVRLGGEPLIGRQLRCLRETGAAELLISGRAGADYSSFGVPVILDAVPGAGPLAGLAAVLKSALFPKTLVLAVDMPAMTPAMLGKILSRCEGDAGCVPLDAGRYEPLAAVYPGRLLPLAEERLAAGRYSMRELVEEAIERGLMRSIPIEAGERIHFLNCNCPSDLARLSG